jgi:hypothetical protein
MAYSISTNGLPYIRTYKQALQHYENIKPVKSKDYYTNGIRPIGPRAKKHMSIHQLSNGDISCRLYSTDCVVYHQDDSITVDFGVWHSVSTSKFIHAISPYTAYSNGYVSTGKGTFKVPTDGLRILPDGTPVNPVQEYRTLLDKKKAAETRKKLKPFLNWVDACLKLGGKFDGVTCDRSKLLRVIEEDESVSFLEAAGYYFPTWADRKQELWSDAYELTDSFIQVPVPVGEMRRPTQWD